MVIFNLHVQVHLTEREKQKLQVRSQIMPYRESFAWAIVSLFDNSIGAASGGSASPSSPLAPSISGSSSHEGVFEPSAKITLDGKPGNTSGSSIVVEISNLNKVKESYTEDSLLVRHASACIFSFSILMVPFMVNFKLYWKLSVSASAQVYFLFHLNVFNCLKKSLFV